MENRVMIILSFLGETASRKQGALGDACRGAAVALASFSPMANRTVKDANSIHGTNPQYLVEKIIRTRIYESKYWKEECFGLTGQYVRLLGAMYMRLTGTAVDCYKYLEPLYNDYRKIKIQNRNGGESEEIHQGWYRDEFWQKTGKPKRF
ncbi:hypothetical protein GOODEAATRI_014591 [Goodea atripinnis]|uniref:Pre-mRNA-splicing factor 38B n=1 Tax=Goodea atripinnis TaxID=208336 RepID=A0ABV0PNN8_9TELE